MNSTCSRVTLITKTLVGIVILRDPTVTEEEESTDQEEVTETLEIDEAVTEEAAVEAVEVLGETGVVLEEIGVKVDTEAVAVEVTVEAVTVEAVEDSEVEAEVEAEVEETLVIRVVIIGDQVEVIQHLGVQVVPHHGETITMLVQLVMPHQEVAGVVAVPLQIMQLLQILAEVDGVPQQLLLMLIMQLLQILAEVDGVPQQLLLMLMLTHLREEVDGVPLLLLLMLIM